MNQKMYKQLLNYDHINKSLRPERENILENNPEQAYEYAKNIIKGPWEKGENAIYKNRRLHGVYRLWYANGQLELECWYNYGKKHGACSAWYANGRVFIDAMYKNGKPHGAYKIWYDDGRIKEEGTYENGVLNGVWKLWNTDGLLIDEVHYRNGKPIQFLTPTPII